LSQLGATLGFSSELSEIEHGDLPIIGRLAASFHFLYVNFEKNSSFRYNLQVFYYQNEEL